MAQYKLGTSDPTITPDAGAGAWNSESTTIEMRVKKAAIVGNSAAAYAIIGDDATMHIIHYFNNTGRDYTIDLEDLIDDVPNEKNLFESEISAAKKFVETLPVGTHQITSGKATGGYITKKENWNWFFAVGGYSVWGKGTATVTAAANGQKSYELDFEYKFFDRYNWDGGKTVEIFGITITDEFMGRFHREGLAQEFNMYGSVKRNFKWGAPTASSATNSRGGRGN